MGYSTLIILEMKIGMEIWDLVETEPVPLQCDFFEMGGISWRLARMAVWHNCAEGEKQTGEQNEILSMLRVVETCYNRALHQCQQLFTSEVWGGLDWALDLLTGRIGLDTRIVSRTVVSGLIPLTSGLSCHL